jgi:rubrerythrin
VSSDHGEPAEEEAQARVARRRLLLGGVTLVTGGASARELHLLGTPAVADRALDVQMLQTSAAVENLAVEVYDAALELAVVGGDRAEPLVRDLFTRTRDQHAEHAKAFNDAVTKLGGRTQSNPDPVLAETVSRARSRLSDAAKVVELGIVLEEAAAQTYQSYAAALSDPSAKVVTAAIMGVEAQHLAVLRAVQALLAGGETDLVSLAPDNAERLPEGAGSAGFPDAFGRLDRSRPAAEGAVG